MAVAVPSCLTQVYLEEMCKVGSLCYERGWTAGTGGNFSVRDKATIWQSPSGVDKGWMNPDSFLPVSMDTGLVINQSLGCASLELPIHLGIYRCFKKARAVVHAHTPELIKLTVKEKDKLVFKGHEMQKSIGGKSPFDTIGLAIADNLAPEDFHKFADPDYIRPRMAGEFPMIILKGHGAYVYGKSPLHALRYLEGLEFLCQTWANH